MDCFSENNQTPLTSDSLDKFHNDMETLKITDDFHQKKHHINNLFINSNQTNMMITNHNEVGLPSKQLHMDTGSNNKMSITNNYIDGIQLSPKFNANEADSMKQKQLSDWYYIKTNPKVKPASPYERRKIKNYPNRLTTTITTKPLIQSQEMLHSCSPSSSTSPLELSIPHQKQFNGNNIIPMTKSTEKINSIQQQHQQQFPQILKNKSNDSIEKKKLFQECEKSPIPQTYKCFDIKRINKNPSGKNNLNFGEMTSSSFEHVNVIELYENHCISGTDIHRNSNVNDLLNLRLREAMVKPLLLEPKKVERQENKVRQKLFFFDLNRF